MESEVVGSRPTGV